MTDYKNTPEGKIVSQKYADILPLSRPEPSYMHPRMSTANRAKIFSPFAALRGYEEEIAAECEDHLKVSKIELSDEDKEKLSNKLLQVCKGMELTVCYFEPSFAVNINSLVPENRILPSGIYKTISGSVDRIDSVYRKLYLSTGWTNQLGKELPLVIRFDDILELSGNDILEADGSLGFEENTDNEN